MEVSSDLNSRKLDYLMPLEFFYLREGRAVPDIEFIRPDEVPEPYSRLLVHESDMTPRLRAFHQADISLRVVSAETAPKFIMRLVVLQRQDTKAPVEVGAIGIQLENFDDATRDLILAGVMPLGAILESRDIPHTSEPKAYFKVKVDSWIGELLHEKEGTILYGRCNSLTHHGGIVFADIVEILPSNP